MQTILVTGGAGYIGSHCSLALLEQNYNVVILDNFSTGHLEIIETLKKYGNVKFYQCDLLELSQLDIIFKENNIDAVVHFAAFSQVAESVINPQKYYMNNICGTLNLLKIMLDNNVKQIVFSSTAATYGEPKYIPIDETHPQEPINPYGKTKLFIEQIMDDYDKAYGLKSVRLRYFNVAGADKQARVGEWHEPETHLIPNILKSTFDKGQTFKMFGDDYETKDGTCVRDYIDIEELVNAHILSLQYLNNGGKTNFFNLGTNNGNSVKEVFSTCEQVTNQKIAVEIMPRREGDPAILIADNKKAKEVLGWEQTKSLTESIKCAYEWEKVNGK